MDATKSQVEILAPLESYFRHLVFSVTSVSILLLILLGVGTYYLSTRGDR